MLLAQWLDSVTALPQDIEGAEHAVLRGGRTAALPWLAQVDWLYLEAHPQLGLGKGMREEDAVQVLWAHNLTVLRTFPRNQWFEHVYLACGPSVGQSLCLAVCRRWKPNEACCQPAKVMRHWRRVV